MGIFSFLGGLFKLAAETLKALLLRWVYQRGVEKGLEVAKEADRHQAITEADAITRLAEQSKERERRAADEKMALDRSDPLDGRVRDDQRSPWLIESDVASPDDPDPGR